MTILEGLHSGITLHHYYSSTIKHSFALTTFIWRDSICCLQIKSWLCQLPLSSNLLTITFRNKSWNTITVTDWLGWLWTEDSISLFKLLQDRRTCSPFCQNYCLERSGHWVKWLSCRQLKGVPWACSHLRARRWRASWAIQKVLLHDSVSPTVLYK